VLCDGPLSGPYYSRCGERTLELEPLTLRHFVVHDAQNTSGKLRLTRR
jgi:hypothetical protein